MKLRKMKERGKIYRAEKDALSLKVKEMQTDNEALFGQISALQENSHKARDENSKLMTKLKQTEKQLDLVTTEMKHVEEVATSIKGQNELVEKEFKGHIRK